MSKRKAEFGFIKPSEIQVETTPRHKRLSKDQQKRVQWIWEAMGPRCGAGTYKKLDHNMRCDMHPDREISIMLAIARAYQEFKQQHPDTDLDKLANTLLLLSLGNPIFHTHAETIERLLTQHCEAVLDEFRQRFGERADELLGKELERQLE